MGFLSLIVISSLVSCWIFTGIVIGLSCVGITIPDVLIQYYFITFGVELGATAMIQIVKYFIEKTEVCNKIKLKKENNIPLESADFDTSENADGMFGSYYGGESCG